MRIIPIEIPDDGNERVISVSGGRTSGYMLWRFLDAHGGQLPPRTRAIFQNTGKEREATLVFLREMSERWSVPIKWLEYRYDKDALGRAGDPKHMHVEVDFDTASRKDEPFAQMVRAYTLLPHVKLRKCTVELKTLTLNRYMRRTLGIKEYRNLIGMRYDEPGRVLKMLKDETCETETPLFHAKIVKKDVHDFWRDSDFDLDLPLDESNCDLCFLKGHRQLLRLIRENPERANWWIEQEQAVTDLRKEHLAPVTFNKRFSYTELRDAALSGEDQLDMFPEEETAYSCFCGD